MVFRLKVAGKSVDCTEYTACADKTQRSGFEGKTSCRDLFSCLKLTVPVVVSDTVDGCGFGVTTSCTRSTAVFESKLNGVGGVGVWDEVTQNPTGAESAKKEKQRKKKETVPSHSEVWCLAVELETFGLSASFSFK